MGRTVRQPVEEVVKGNDGEEFEEGDDEFEIAIAKRIREAIEDNSYSDYESEEEESDDSESEFSMFGDLDENNFLERDEYDDPAIAQMFKDDDPDSDADQIESGGGETKRKDSNRP